MLSHLPEQSATIWLVLFVVPGLHVERQGLAVKEDTEHVLATIDMCTCFSTDAPLN